MLIYPIKQNLVKTYLLLSGKPFFISCGSVVLINLNICLLLWNCRRNLLACSIGLRFSLLFLHSYILSTLLGNSINDNYYLRGEWVPGSIWNKLFDSDQNRHWVLGLKLRISVNRGFLGWSQFLCIWAIRCGIFFLFNRNEFI